MRGGVIESFKFDLMVVLILLLCFRDSSCSSMNHPKVSLIEDIKDATLSLETSPTASPQPLLPLLAPSPLAPFTNRTSPKLSVATEVSGCLLPSLPPDAILDKILGIGFVCDLNDNIPAPWPSMSHSTASSCKKSVRIPALPVVASGQISFRGLNIWSHLLLAASMILQLHCI